MYWGTQCREKGTYFPFKGIPLQSTIWIVYEITIRLSENTPENAVLPFNYVIQNVLRAEPHRRITFQSFDFKRTSFNIKTR